MKKLFIILTLLFCGLIAKSQNNYLLPNSVAGVEITETGSGLLWGQNHKDTSEVTSSQTLWFVSPRGIDPATSNYFQAGRLNVVLKNITTSFKKFYLYDFTGTNLLYSQNIAPSSEICLCFPSHNGDIDRRLDAAVNYYWKFENVASQSVVCRPDVINIPASNFGQVDVLNNDLNLPQGADCRLKSGQTLSNITVTKDQYTGLKVTTNANQGTYYFTYEAIDSNNNVLGESTVTVTVGSASQFCTLAILDEKLLAGSQTIHEFTLYSPNAQINPFNYEVKNATTGLVVKTGTTPPATSNKEIIDFGTLPTGTYTVKFSSSVSQCFDVKQVSHVQPNEACNASIISIDKVASTNNYIVNASFSNVASVRSVVTSATQINLVVSQTTNVTTQSFQISLPTSQTGVYFVSIEGEGKYCVAQKSFDHNLVAVQSGANKLETWTKYIHNYKDKIVLSGKLDNESGRDKFGQLSFSENKTNLVWRAFISDFENLSNSQTAKAIVGIRLDTSRSSRYVSIAVMPNAIVLQTRGQKSGNITTVATASGVTAPCWVEVSKNGNDVTCSYSKDLTMNPTMTTLGTIIGGASGFGQYQKFFGMTSGRNDVIANATFRGFLGGDVDFTPPSITIVPPLIASNVTNPTSGQSVTLNSNGCTGGATNKWFKNAENVSFASGNSVNISAYNNDAYYALCQNGINTSLRSNTITFSIVGSLISCSNAGSFDVLTAVYASNQVTFQFNASNLTNGNYTVLNGSTSIKTGLFSPNGSSVTVSTGALSAGNYLLKINGISCSGTAQKSFIVSGGTVAVPTIYSSPSNPISGNNVTLTATGCSGNYNWHRNAEINPFASTSGTTSIISASGGAVYFAKCVGANDASNYITIGNSPINGNEDDGVLPVTTFINYTKQVPVVTTNGIYNPHLFPTISTPLSTDGALGKLYPNWAVAWQCEGGNFLINNRKTTDLGISFMYDWRPANYAGYGVRCLDWVYETNPNTGQPWNNNIDEVCNIPFTTFTSRVPFHQRASSLYGVASTGDRNEWIGQTNEWAYDKGVESVQARMYGHGDKVNGKVNTGLTNTDIEIGLEQGFEYFPRHLSFMLGMASASHGYVFSQYSAAINEPGVNLSFYPDDNGNFPSLRKDIDGSNKLNGNGGTDVNNIPISPDWNPTSKITNGRVTNKGVIDYPNLLPCIEISSTSDMTYRHGETYPRKGGWVQNGNGDWVYSVNNPMDNTVVDKFGMNRNTNHIIADIICYGDVNKWWSVNKLNGRKVMLQSKITCDRANMGIYHDAGFTNQSLRFKHYDREYGFDIGGFTALTGCEWQIWDRNTQENLDGYHGAFGVVNLMNQQKTFGSTSVSFTSLKPRLNFLLWNSEISYDGGVSYVKDKATEYVLSENKLPQRQAVSSDGYWVIFAARPEGIEPTTAKFRVNYNGNTYYHTITNDDWETVDYAYRNTSLESLPIDKKDYYYTIIKLGSQATGGVSVNPPVIQSSPSNPTAGVSTTLTASGCAGTVRWFVTNSQVGTGTPFTVASPIAGQSYSATCTVNSVASSASNVITIGTSPVGGVTITEPNKPQYYFTNGQPASYYLNTDGSFTNNLPVIYRSNTRNVSNYGSRPVHPTIRMQSGYSMTEDVVWLKNNKVEFGINLLRGGQLAWASTINATTNLIYNGYDGGFQVTLDAYQKKDGYSQNGKYSRQQFDEILQFSGDPDALNAVGNKININSYNTTMGGDFVNNSQSLLYHYRQGNSYIVGVRPIFYTIDSEFSKVIIETKYTLEPDEISLKIEHKYKSLRDDGQYAGGGFDGAAAPACFLVNTLSKYRVHDGDNLLTGDLPVQNYGQPILGVNTNKKYLCVYNPNTNASFGVYKIIAGQSAYAKLKQLEVNGSAGTEFTGGFTYVDFKDDFVASIVDPIPDRGNFEKTMVSYVMVGNNPTEIDNEANRLKILTGN